MKPTIKQLKYLQTAKDDGGILEIGGIDGRKINMRVWANCVQNNWLEVQHAPMPYEFYWSLRLTQSGSALLPSSASQPLIETPEGPEVDHA